VVPDIESIVKRNSRSADALAGDLRAQVGCTSVGAQRLRGLCAEYGTDTIKEAFAQLRQLAEQRVRRGIAAWPDGEAEAESWVDNDGVDLDVPLRIHARVTKRGDELTIDYSQMNEQVKGPLNLRPQSSEMGGLMAVLTFLDPTIPMNDGFRGPITFINPPGKITNAQWPAPVNNYFGLTSLVYNTVQKALATFNPERAVGSCGLGQGAISVGYRRTRGGRQGVQYEIMATSLGGTPEHDGASPVLTMAHVTPNTPVEVLETEFPVRVKCHRWLRDSAGPGLHRGGPGYRKEYEVLDEATFTLRVAHNFHHSGWGVVGGKSPPTTRAYADRGLAHERPLGPLETMELGPAESFCLDIPGGGGSGDPLLRPPERVLEDVLDRLVSTQAAERDYGVIIDAAGRAIDHEATDRLRASRRGEGGVA
jgi:N-methylhydantoinase B